MLSREKKLTSFTFYWMMQDMVISPVMGKKNLRPQTLIDWHKKALNLHNTIPVRPSVHQRDQF